jgi:hypothetical protein
MTWKNYIDNFCPKILTCKIYDGFEPDKACIHLKGEGCKYAAL